MIIGKKYRNKTILKVLTTYLIKKTYFIIVNEVFFVTLQQIA